MKHVKPEIVQPKPKPKQSEANGWINQINQFNKSWKNKRIGQSPTTPPHKKT